MTSSCHAVMSQTENILTKQSRQFVNEPIGRWWSRSMQPDVTAIVNDSSQAQTDCATIRFTSSQLIKQTWCQCHHHLWLESSNRKDLRKRTQYPGKGKVNRNRNRCEISTF